MNFITYKCLRSRSLIDLCQGHMNMMIISQKDTTSLNDSIFHMNPIRDENSNANHMVIVT